MKKPNVAWVSNADHSKEAIAGYLKRHTNLSFYKPEEFIKHHFKGEYDFLIINSKLYVQNWKAKKISDLINKYEVKFERPISLVISLIGKKRNTRILINHPYKNIINQKLEEIINNSDNAQLIPKDSQQARELVDSYFI
jgi:hypothetical protein